MKSQKRKSTRDTCDTRDTRQIDKSQIMYPPPFRLRGAEPQCNPFTSETAHRWKELAQLEHEQPHRIPWSGAIRKRKLKNPSNVIADELERIASAAAVDDDIGWQARYDLLTFSRALVERMNLLVAKNPEHWRGFADTEIFWPCNVSLHPHYIKGMKKGAAIRNFLEKTLQLGKNHAVQFDPYSKSKLTSPITREAMRLISHVFRAWRTTTHRYTDNPDTLRGYAELRKRITGWRLEADDLPPPVKRNAKKWADVAIKSFLESYPNPEKIQELADEIGAHFSKDKEVESLTADSYTPGKLRGRILSRLHKAICDLLVDAPG